MNVPHYSALGLALLLLLQIAGCGSNSNTMGNNSTPQPTPPQPITLQSLSINPPAATAQGGTAQFTASAQVVGSAVPLNPASVDWFDATGSFEPATEVYVGYSLSTAPHTAKCLYPGTRFAVVAFAPIDGNAPAKGSMLLGDFMNLVAYHTVTQEGGFIATTAWLTSP